MLAENGKWSVKMSSEGPDAAVLIQPSFSAPCVCPSWNSGNHMFSLPSSADHGHFASSQTLFSNLIKRKNRLEIYPGRWNKREGCTEKDNSLNAVSQNWNSRPSTPICTHCLLIRTRKETKHSYKKKTESLQSVLAAQVGIRRALKHPLWKMPFGKSGGPCSWLSLGQD